MGSTEKYLTHTQISPELIFTDDTLCMYKIYIYTNIAIICRNKQNQSILICAINKLLKKNLKDR